MKNISRWPAFCVISLMLAMTVITLGRSSAVAQDQVSPTLIVFADTVIGAKNIPDDQRATRLCVLSSRYPRNAELVWRVRVIDPKTGQPMDDTMLTKVEVTLSDGQVIELNYGQHPPAPNPARDYYWANAWLIPKDYPTGTLGYTVIATATDGRTGEYKPFDIASSLPSVTDEVLADIEEEEE